VTISYLSSTTGSNTVCLEQDYSHPEQCIDNDFSLICPCIRTESWPWAENVYRVETQIETAGQPVLSVSSRQTVRQTPGSDGTN